MPDTPGNTAHATKGRHSESRARGAKQQTKKEAVGKGGEDGGEDGGDDGGEGHRRKIQYSL